MSTDRWRDRWINTHADLIAARAECLTLRTALDELNRDDEGVLNEAGQTGVEKAKSWLITQQRATIRAQRQELNS